MVKMFDEIQQIIAPHTLSSFDYTKIEELLQTYTEEEILSVYRSVGYKPMNYISKVLSKRPRTSSWLKKEIVNEPIDKETEEVFNDFQNFLKEFRS